MFDNGNTNTLQVSAPFFEILSFFGPVLSLLFFAAPITMHPNRISKEDFAPLPGGQAFFSLSQCHFVFPSKLRQNTRLKIPSQTYIRCQRVWQRPRLLCIMINKSLENDYQQKSVKFTKNRLSIFSRRSFYLETIQNI